MQIRRESTGRYWWRRAVVPLVIGASLILAAAPGHVPTATAQPAQRDIVDTVAAAGQFGTLMRALQTAGMVDTLKGPGPFTFWAPPDAAFDKLPSGTLDTLMRNPDEMRNLVRYHMASGAVTAAQVIQVPTVRTTQGEPVTISVAGGAVHINDATVIQADLQATNGIIHVVDSVLLPSALRRPQELPRAGEPGLPFPFVVAAGAVLIGIGLVFKRARAAPR